MDVTRVQVVPIGANTNTLVNLHTGSGLVIVELKQFDTVWIEPYSQNMDVWYFFSCLSIVKLKWKIYKCWNFFFKKMDTHIFIICNYCSSTTNQYKEKQDVFLTLE